MRSIVESVSTTFRDESQKLIPGVLLFPYAIPFVHFFYRTVWGADCQGKRLHGAPTATGQMQHQTGQPVGGVRPSTILQSPPACRQRGPRYQCGAGISRTLRTARPVRTAPPPADVNAAETAVTLVGKPVRPKAAPAARWGESLIVSPAALVYMSLSASVRPASRPGPGTERRPAPFPVRSGMLPQWPVQVHGRA